MEAIVHLIGAVIHGFILLAEIILRSVIFQIEAIRYGYDEALVRSNRRQADGISPFLSRLTAAGLLAVSFGAVGTLSYVWHSVHAKRIATTEQLVNRLAEKYYQETTKPDAQFQNDPLAEVDAWGRPVRLDAEKSLLGWWIVVSSDGPDGRPATSDDVKSIRQNWNNLEQVGGELAQRGTNKVKEKIKGLFTGSEPDEALPADEQPAEQDEQEDAVVALEITVEDEPPSDDAKVAEDDEKKGWKLPFKFGFGKSD